MVEVVPARVIGRVAKAEVRAEVDHRPARGHQARDDGRGLAVRQGDEDGVAIRQGRVHAQVGAREVGSRAADRLRITVAAHEAYDGDGRMAGQPAHQLATDIAGGPDDRHADPSVRCDMTRRDGRGCQGRGVQDDAHRMHEYTAICMLMQP